ncbi:MAG: hypothetical protein P8X85_17365, partial [Desulfobacterales bacterium]
LSNLSGRLVRPKLTLLPGEMIESLIRVSNMIKNHFTKLQQKSVTRNKSRQDLDELIKASFFDNDCLTLRRLREYFGLFSISNDILLETLK